MTEELDDAARWEVESLLPFPLDKAYLDWMVLERAKDWVRVLVVALPQELVESYALVLEEVGYQPVAFEITSLSLARMVEKETGTTMVVDVDEKEAVSVVVGPKGGIEVSSTAVFSDEKEVAGDVVETVKKLLVFYRRKVGEDRDGRKISKIFFCGQRARPELIQKVKAEVGIEGVLVKAKRPDLAAFASLAQKDVAAPIDENTINLIPPRIQGIYDQAARVREISGWLKIGLLFMLIIFFSYSVSAAWVYFETKRIENEIVKHQASLTPEMIKIESQAKLLNSQAKKIITLSGPRSEIASWISLILEKKPAGVIITHFSYDGDKEKAWVDGTAPNREALLSFQDTLKKTEEFSQVFVPLSSLEREVNVEFTLALTGQSEN
jgi:hypothetical protein